MNHLTLRELSRDKVFEFLLLVSPFVLVIISSIIAPISGFLSPVVKFNWEEYFAAFIINILLAVLLGYIGYSILRHYLCRKECKCQTSRAVGFYLLSLIFFSLWPIAMFGLVSYLVAFVLSILLAVTLVLLIPETIEYNLGVFFGGAVALLISVVLMFLSARKIHYLK